jgi:ABC-type iron transport system FetAB ATPase subunit
VLGDNGAGKSTFIKTLSGYHSPDSGEMLIDGEPVRFSSPRDALDRGIATVYQDLAIAPLMPVWRNFFLGSEPTRLGMIRTREAKRIVVEEMAKMGISVRDPDQPIGTMSGGERQCVAIARAVYFGARVLILDEPTAALGVRQSGVVLKYVMRGPRARPRRHLHHPQPQPRLPGRRPLRAAEARPDRLGHDPGGDHPARASPRRWPAAPSSRRSSTSWGARRRPRDVRRGPGIARAGRARPGRATRPRTGARAGREPARVTF